MKFRAIVMHNEDRLTVDEANLAVALLHDHNSPASRSARKKLQRCIDRAKQPSPKSYLSQNIPKPATKLRLVVEDDE